MSGLKKNQIPYFLPAMFLGHKPGGVSKKNLGFKIDTTRVSKIIPGFEIDTTRVSKIILQLKFDTSIGCADVSLPKVRVSRTICAIYCSVS
jgi:hypothetical protein